MIHGDIQMLLNQLDEIVERIKRNDGNCVLVINRSVFGNNAEQVIDFFNSNGIAVKFINPYT